MIICIVDNLDKTATNLTISKIYTNEQFTSAARQVQISRLLSNYKLISYSTLLEGFCLSSGAAIGENEDSVRCVMISPVAATICACISLYERLFFFFFLIQGRKSSIILYLFN